jgi:hypothetical protein
MQPLFDPYCYPIMPMPPNCMLWRVIAVGISRATAGFTRGWQGSWRRTMSRCGSEISDRAWTPCIRSCAPTSPRACSLGPTNAFPKPDDHQCAIHVDPLKADSDPTIDGNVGCDDNQRLIAARKSVLRQNEHLRTRPRTV